MRLIDADALKKRAIRVSTVKEHCYMKAVGTHEIDKAPTVDAVEVVRCKDCRQRYKKTESGKLGLAWCSKWGNIIVDNDFCSYRERKEK